MAQPSCHQHLAAANYHQAAITATNLTHWRLRANIAINAPTFHGSARILWQQSDNDNYLINIFTPFASNDITIYSTNNYKSVTTKHGTRYGTNLEQLLSHDLGWQLPLTALSYWIRGLPAANWHTTKFISCEQQLTNIMQTSAVTTKTTPPIKWHIIITNYVIVNNIRLPQRLNLVAANLKIKIVISHWSNV